MAGWGEGFCQWHRLDSVQWADEVRGETQHHRRFPFTRVAHLVLLEIRLGLPRFGAKLPISGKQQE